MSTTTAPTSDIVIPGLEEIAQLNAEFETAPAEDILRWAVERFRPRIALTSSFGASAGAILHMLAQIDRHVPVIFLQTHYHFAETLRLRDQIADLYGLTVENWEVWGGRPAFLHNYPDDLNKHADLRGVSVPDAAKPLIAQGKMSTGVDLCCWHNKVEPLRRALRNRLAYLTSLRRDGGSEVRARTQFVEMYKPADRDEPLIKVNPMANWDKKKLWKYIYEHEVPVHELYPLGYKSIGCAPCTNAVGDGGSERDGRWSGIVGKVECGIHTADAPVNFTI